VSIGLALAVLGPSLLALGKQTNRYYTDSPLHNLVLSISSILFVVTNLCSELDSMGYVFSARSVGYLVGSGIVCW
jgi:hypothetical protein